jgi:hypothetical protein
MEEVLEISLHALALPRSDHLPSLRSTEAFDHGMARLSRQPEHVESSPPITAVHTTISFTTTSKTVESYISGKAKKMYHLAAFVFLIVNPLGDWNFLYGCS